MIYIRLLTMSRHHGKAPHDVTEKVSQERNLYED